jgi:uncharacterized protein YabN with tetrapyrrole methylase and pyrophosphatase domain
VGTGLKLVAQMTLEAKAYIEQADQVFYVLNDGMMAEWVRELNKTAVSLSHLYHPDKVRLQTYQEMSDLILAAVRQEKAVCVVMYGHPGVFAMPVHKAVAQARQEGYPAAILPGVSAEDCLFADLDIDPGQYGCYSVEATDFLIRRRQPDITGHLIVWQIGAVGILRFAGDLAPGLQVLTDELLCFYAPTHKVTVYEASKYPTLPPLIERLPLVQLPQATVTRMATLYVPPQEKAVVDWEMVARLGMEPDDLRWRRA